MSAPTMSPVKRSRWMDWQPKTRIVTGSPEGEPTKPTEPASVGFDGVASAEPTEIRAEPHAPELDRATTLLNRAGVRIMRLEGGFTVGVWCDLDGPEIRAALRTLDMDDLPIRYLDGPRIPMRYKLREVDGEPVPMSVLAEMQRQPETPWKVRDRMLTEMGWRPEGIPWAEWKAAALNRLLGDEGTSGRSGRVTAATVRHGMNAPRKEKTWLQ